MTTRPPRTSIPRTQVGTDLPDTGSPGRPDWAVVGVVVAVVVVIAAIALPVVILRTRDDRPAQAQDRSGPATTFDPHLTVEERELLARIPFVVRIEGSRVVWGPGVRCAREDVAQAAVASFACELRDAGAERVRYTAFASASAMARAYERLRTAARIRWYEGACRDGPPAEGNWQLAGTGRVVPDGRVLCLDRGGVGMIVWTRNDLGVLSEASSSGDWAALHHFWIGEAGPVG